MIQKDVQSLDALKQTEKEALTKMIGILGDTITEVARPRKLLHKSDMTRWRQIFELYLNAAVFFSTTEKNREVRNPDEAQTQLQLFRSQVEEQKLLDKFKLSGSHKVWEHFMALNEKILKFHRFQLMNSEGLRKIIKSKRLILKSLFLDDMG